MTTVSTRIRWPSGALAWFDSAQSSLNPYNNDFDTFVYGTFPLFLSKALGELMGMTVYGDAHVPGRLVSAVADLGTVALTMWIGYRLFGRATGLVAGLLLAASMLNIQTAHFFTVDAVATCFTTATFAFALAAARESRWHWFVLAGLSTGLAAASKPNLLIIMAFLLLPMLEQIRTSCCPLPRNLAWQIGIGTLGAFFTAFITFRIFQPYAFAGPHAWSLTLDPRWVADLQYWREVQAGLSDTPPNIQWVGRPPMIFTLDNLVRWGMGPGLGLSALAGAATMGVRLMRAREWPSWWHLALVGWPAVTLLLYGGGFVQAQRYQLPAYPFLVILSAWALTRLFAWGWVHSSDEEIVTARWRRLGFRAGIVVPVMAVLFTVWYGFATSLIYTRPHTREAASEWIYENVPAGSVIATEHWDYGLPVLKPEWQQDRFTGVQLELYNADDTDKLKGLVQTLDRADYLVMSSDRLIGSIPRMPDRYPMTTAYYDALLDGALGFDLIASFTSPPSFLGVRLDDRGAEESLTVYDHPQVRVFVKTGRWSPRTAAARLDRALNAPVYGPAPISPTDPTVSQIMLSPHEQARYAAAGTWRDIFDPTNRYNRWPVLWWYLALQLLAWPFVPVTWRWFGALPDRGYAVAKTLGLLAVSWFAWLVPSLNLGPFDPAAIGVGWLLGLGVAGLALKGKINPFRQYVRERWRQMLDIEAGFALVFLAVIWMRAQNPDLWHLSRGGEKPMDFTILNAILRSPRFPPYDPWFAGGTLHYYYFGHVPYAALTRVTGIVPEVAYNLAVPTVAALLALNVWSAVAALLSRLNRDEPRSRRRPFSHGMGGWAIAATATVLALGNLDFARRLGRGEYGAPTVTADVPLIGGVIHFLAGTTVGWLRPLEYPPDAFWAPTRVINGTINEFPFFSVLFGDLHAHLLAMPVTTATVVVAIAFVSAALPAIGDPPRIFAALGGGKRAVAFAAIGGLLSGSLLASHPWDYPAATVVMVFAAVIAVVRRDAILPGWTALRDVALWTGVLIITGRLLFWPYIARYGGTPSALAPVDETTRLNDYLAINGLLLFGTATFLAMALIRVWFGQRRASWLVRWSFRLALLLGLAIVASGVFTASVKLVILGLLALLALAAWHHRTRRGYLLALGLTGLGLSLQLFGEVQRLAFDVGRMNTVFKLWLLAWLLLGIAGAAGGIHAALSWRRSNGERQAAALWRRPVAVSWTTVLVVLLLAAATYPLRVTGPRLDDQFTDLPATLDGFAFMKRATIQTGATDQPPVEVSLVHDLEAISWLRQTVDGTPVILEANLPDYQWGGRISTFTGLPTVLGWSFHETQQRPGYGTWVEQRKADVTTIYSDPVPLAMVEPLLQRYGVRLIYVGELERALYPVEGLAKFDEAADDGRLEVLYQTEQVTIYSYSAPQPQGEVR
jgi:YYY domain-containing protein